MPNPATLGQITDVFVRYGSFTLGGGSATTAVMHGQIVTKRRWLDDDKSSLCFALGRVTPGTDLLTFGTGVGWMVRGLSGAIVALLAGSIPCALMNISGTSPFASRHSPAKQNQSSPALVNRYLFLDGFVPANSENDGGWRPPELSAA